MPGVVPDRHEPDRDAVAAQLARILASDGFAHAPVLCRFLQCVVAHWLAGSRTPLKEYAIGVEVFARGAAFDPGVDTIVRVEARRLRRRLEAYYAREGSGDQVWITLPKGHYAIAVTVADPAVHDPDRGAGQPSSSGDGAPADWLPAIRTSLVGRERELSEVVSALEIEGARLVTLTGPAGVGKTRLALEAAWRIRAARPAGRVLMVPVATATDASMLVLALMRAMGLRTADATTPIENVCRYLHRVDRSLLLWLDNLEQVAGAAPVIGRLLDACARLRILATSRAAVRVYGERVYGLSPLALPERDASGSGPASAVALFVQRARAADPHFQLGARNSSAVVELCRRVDGLPLGIELAAAQCRFLSPSQLLRQVATPLDWPTPVEADESVRRPDLRAAIGWSYRLLGARERVLYRWLAVFPASFTLEAARAVAESWRHPSIGTAAGIERLIDGSLLRVSREGAEPRYSMLQTIRAFGVQALIDSGEYAAACRAHAAWCLVLAEEGYRLRSRRQRNAWLARCDPERANFQFAIGNLVAEADASWALRLLRALFPYWWARGHVADARGYHRAVLRGIDAAARPGAWASVMCHAGMLSDCVGEFDAARSGYREVIAVARERGDRDAEVMALTSLGASYELTGACEDARDCFEQCLRVCTKLADPNRIAAARCNLGNILLFLGDRSAATRLFRKSLATFRQLHRAEPAAWCLNSLGDVAAASGRYRRAQECYRQAIAGFAALHDRLGLVLSLADLGHLALRRGRSQQAAGEFMLALDQCRRRDVPDRAIVNVLEGCALLATDTGHPADAVTLAAAADALRAGMRMRTRRGWNADLEAALERAGATLPSAELQACRRRGAQLGRAGAVACAAASLGDLSRRAPPARLKRRDRRRPGSRRGPAAA